MRVAGSYIRIIGRRILISAPTLTVSQVRPILRRAKSSHLHYAYAPWTGSICWFLLIQLLPLLTNTNTKSLLWKTLSHAALPHAAAWMLHNRISCHWFLPVQGCHLDSETCHTLGEIKGNVKGMLIKIITKVIIWKGIYWSCISLDNQIAWSSRN